MKYRYLSVLAIGLALAACGNDENDEDSEFSTHDCVKEARANCIEIPAGDSLALLEAVNDLKPNTTVILGKGVYQFENTVTITASGTHLIGQGIDGTTLDFGSMTTNGDGVIVMSVDNFLVQDLTIIDSVKDGIRVEDSDGVVFRRMRATWTNEGDKDNGAYGIYPVKCKNVLVEDCYAENASDAGLYVGQTIYTIVRNNVVTGNVAGLEIENTQYADVYGNLAEDNTGGIVVFDMPKNPIVGRDVRIRNNTVRGNNRKNFAPMGMVKEIPAGTGTFTMASRRVEITDNHYENNKTIDIAIISGMLTEEAGTEAVWDIEESVLIADWDDLDLPEGTVPGTITNHSSNQILISGNTHVGSGMDPDKTIPLGALLSLMFKDTLPVPSVIYENLGETSFDLEAEDGISNDNHVCVGGNTGGDFVVGDVKAGKFQRYTKEDFGPFGCDELKLGHVAEVELPVK